MKRIIVAALLMFSIASQAQTTYTWNGSSSSSWTTNTNWTPNGVPLATDHVVIVSAGSTPVLTAGQTVTNFTLTSGTLDLGGFTLTINGNSTFTTGTIQNGTVTVTGATTAVFGNGPVTMNCITNITAATLTIRNTTFQNTTTLIKTGASNDAGYGQNTFNGTTSITNNGTGYWLSTNNVADVYNGNVTFTSTSGRVIPVQNGTGTQFNGNITINCTSATGSVEIGNAAGTSTLAASTVITVGGSGFSDGTFELNKVTQAGGGAAQNITLTGAATFQITACTFTAATTFTAPRLNIDNNSFGSTVFFTKNGTGGDSCGGNTFSAGATLTNSSGSNFQWGATVPDIFNSTLVANNTGTAFLYLANSSAGNQFNGAVTLNNSGSGADNYILVSENGGSSSTFNSTVTVNNTSTATNALVRFHLSGTCAFNDNIILNSTGTGYGIYFGWSGYTGTGSLANSRTVTLGGTGFTAGNLRFYNFTQLGNTPQSLVLTGTNTLLLISGSTFNGNVNFTAPRVRLDGSVYNGSAIFTKTGTTDDAGTGGNTFAGDVVLNNSATATGYLMTGNGTADTFAGNLTLNDQSSNHIYVAYSHDLQTTTIAGNLVINNDSNNGDVRFSDANLASHVSITGTTTISNTGSSRYSIFGTGTGTNTVFGGTVTIDNLGTASRVYLSRRGTTTFSENIIVSSTSSSFIGFGELTGTATLAAGKTISVGGSGFSSGQLNLGYFTQTGATPQALTLTGTTTSLTVGPSSAFGGDVVFSSPSILLNASTFSGTSSFTKTGTPNDNSPGGNTFTGISTITNTGSGAFRFANTTADNFVTHVVALNSGSGILELAYNSAGNLFGGNLSMTNTASGTSTELTLARSNNATATVTGDLTVNHSGSATNNNAYFANGTSASLTVNGNLTITSSGSGTNNNVYLANGTSGVAAIGGNLIAVNSGTGSNTNDMSFASSGSLSVTGTSLFQNNATGAYSRIFLAETTAASSVVFQNDVTFINSAVATSDAYIRVVRGIVTFNGNVSVSSTTSTPAGYNGIYLCWPGNYTGNATLANTKTITVGAGGFTAGNLYLLRFTQIGSTPQAMTLTNTSTLYLGPTSSFSASDVQFASPSIYLDGASYAGTSAFTKTGATNNTSAGGNMFTGASTLTNSGSGVMRLAGTTADTFVSDVIASNTGTGSLLLAYSSAGNSFGGNLTMNNSASGASNTMTLADQANATATVSGNLTINNTGSGTNNTISISDNSNTNVTIGGNLSATHASTGTGNNYLYLGNYGSVSVVGTTTLTNTSSGTNADIFIAQNSANAVFNGSSLQYTSTSSATGNNRFYFGQNGDCSLTGDLTILHSPSVGSQSTIAIANLATSSLLIGGNLSITNGGSCSANEVYLSYSGTATIVGTSTILNTASAGQSRIFLCESAAASSISFGGTVTLSNLSTHATGDSYIRINSGTVSFNGNLVVNNTAPTSGGNNGIYLCWSSANTGTATLANTRTITVGGSGFSTGTLRLLRFTQVGSTPQTLTLTGTSTLIVGPGSAFGGNVTFTAPSLFLNGCVYSGTSSFTKTGSTTDNGNGGNIFAGVSTIVNSGSGILRLANTTADNFVSDVTASNTGSGSLALAYTAAGNLFGGNVTLNNSANGASNVISICENTNATAAITGNLNITNTGSGTSNSIYLSWSTGTSMTIGGDLTIVHASTGTANNYCYVGQNGGVSVTGNTSVTNTSSGANSGVFMANGIAASSFTCSGNVIFNHAGSGTTGNEFYLANYGTINISGTTTITNNSTGGTSYVRIGESSNTASATFGSTFTASSPSTATNSFFRVLRGIVTFNGDVILSNTSTSAGGNNGFYVGWSGYAGNATLASGRTISVGGSGFTTGILQLYNFTQSGSTAQNLALTGNARLAIGLVGQPSIFNGDLTFSCSGGSATLNGSTFARSVTGSAVGIAAVSNAFNTSAGTTQLTSNIASAANFDCGGNTFNGATTFNSNGVTGSTWRWGQPAADVFSSTLALNLTAPGALYLSRTTGTSTFAGNITIASPSTGALYFGNNGGNSTLASGTSIATSGTATGLIDLKRITQLGTAANSFTLGGTATLTLGGAAAGNTFGGPVTYTCASTSTLTANTFADLTGTATAVIITSNTFNGTTALTKNGTSNDDTNGGNIFNGTTTLTTTNTGRWRLGSSTADDFNGAITFLQNGTGLLQPAYTNASTFSGNISTVGSGTALTFGVNGGRVTIDGSSNQTWSGDVARKPIVNRLTMQTSGGSTLQLSVPLDIATDLTLTTGKILTDATNILTLTDESVTVTNTSVSSTSYVDGPLNYTTNTNAASSTLFFPIGDGTSSRPVQLTYTHTNTTAVTYTAENFTGTAASLGFALPGTLERISGARYYKVDRTSVANLTNARIRIYYDTDDQVTDFANLKVAKSTGNVSPWTDIGGTATANGTGNILSNTFTSFSYFSLANGTGGTNPLPIELLNFAARVNAEKKIDLLWSTTSELNNDYFTVERSADGKKFEKVLSVKGAGTSHEVQTYSAIDNQPYAGLSYYRLKQTDFDGKFTYSAVVSVRMELDFALYPNPSAGEFFIQFPSTEKIDRVTLQFENSLGQPVRMADMKPDRSGLVHFKQADSLPSGVYLLKITTSNLVFYQRVIIQ